MIIGTLIRKTYAPTCHGMAPYIKHHGTDAECCGQSSEQITVVVFFQTVRTLAGVMYCLARNPDKQAKLAAEIDRIAPDKTAPITGKQIESASYLKACVKEGFRLFM